VIAKQYIATIAFLLLIASNGFCQQKDLNYYINYAIQSSPLLKDFNNQISSTRIDSQLTRTKYVPQVNAVTNNVVAPVINGYGYDQNISNTGAYSALVSANKTFVGKKNLNAQLKTSGLQIDSLSNTATISEQDLKKTVIAQFITAYGDQQQLLNYTRINDILSQEEIILKKLTTNNIYRQTDYLTFLVTYKQQQLLLRQLQIQYQTDFANLNYLCGILDTAANATTLADPDLQLLPLPDPSLSAFFDRYLIDSMLLQNNIALTNLAYRPRLSVFGDAGYVSSFLLDGYKNFGFSAGFNITVPIFDGHRRKLNITKTNLLENTRLNYKDFFTAQYNQQIATYIQQLHSTESLLTDIQEQVKYTEGLISVNKKLLETGDVKISDFVIAINNYLTAQYLTTQNKISRFQIINQINYYSR